MKSRFILGCLLLSLVFPLSGASARNPVPLLDVRVRDGQLQDFSHQLRTIKQSRLQPADNGRALIVPNGAVKIAHDQHDPLFQAGPRTWMLRFKIRQNPEDGYYPILGQWRPATNDRQIAFILKGGSEGQVSFHVSPSGGVQDQSTAILKGITFGDEWITLIGCYRPGEELALLAYDDQRNLLGEARTSRGVPEAQAPGQVDFELGAPRESGFQVSTLRIWEGVPDRTQLLESLSLSFRK